VADFHGCGRVGHVDDPQAVVDVRRVRQRADDLNAVGQAKRVAVADLDRLCQGDRDIVGRERGGVDRLVEGDSM